MKIALFGQYNQEYSRELIQIIENYFISKNVYYFFEKSFLEGLVENNVILRNNLSQTINPQNCDVLIGIGGDGTMLKAVTIVKNSNIPIMGINAGRLGFLATIPKNNIEFFLEKIIRKEFRISPRTLLCLQTHPVFNEIENLNFALNEITVSRKDTASMIRIEASLNDEYLNSYWADGLIISTPTGSTGYSLSCGGPVIMPTTQSLIITPIAPHNLNARPLVIPDNMVIKLKVSGRELQHLVSLDSRILIIPNNVELTIQKNKFSINLIEFSEETFIKTLRMKLLWGEDKRN
jgi:NAD+ kinase